MPHRTCNFLWHNDPSSWRLTNLMHRLAGLLILPLLFIGLSTTPARAKEATPTPTAPHVNPDQAQQLLDVLNDNTKRQQFITTLTNLTAAQKATHNNAASEPSLLDQTLDNLSVPGRKIVTRLHVFTQTISNFRSLGSWAQHIWQSPDLQPEIIHICFRVIMMVICGVALSYTIRILLNKPRHHLEKMARRDDYQTTHHVTEEFKLEKNTPLKKVDEEIPRHDTTENSIDLETHHKHLNRQDAPMHLMVVLHRLPYTLGCLGLDILGTLMFPLVTLLIQAIDPGPDAQTMQTVWRITWLASVSLGLWLAILRALLAPQHAWLRLSTLRDRPANFLYQWLHRIGILISWNITVLIILHDCTVPQNITLVLAKLLALSVHVMIAFMIVNSRNTVTQTCEHSRQRNKHIAKTWRIFAKTWWVIALFFDIALWLVWATDVNGDYQLILRLLVRTCIALLLVRIVSILLYDGLERSFHAINAWRTSKETKTRILRYYPAAQHVISIIIGLLILLALALAWDAPICNILEQHSFGTQILSSLLTIIVALLVGTGIWEASNITIDHHIRHLEKEGGNDNKARMARIRTLQPMFRIILLTILSIVIGLTILSQLGVNTAPLLASASIFGVALGFGSQKLVQDFISGIFLLMENALTVGDAVTLNGTYGIIEKLSLRTVHVRANDGSINIFSFSSLGHITNYSRDFARAIILAEVSYETDTDDAVQALHDITAEMRADPVFKDMIIDNLNIWGVDSLNESSVTIKGTLPTTPGGRWPVQRQFNRRMKKSFQERGIGIAFPTRILNIPSLTQFLDKQSPQPKQKESGT